jgi:hypothetical protein
MVITDKADFHTKVRCIHAPITKRPRENPFLLPKAIPQVRRIKVHLFMDGLIVLDMSRQHPQSQGHDLWQPSALSDA